MSAKNSSNGQDRVAVMGLNPAAKAQRTERPRRCDVGAERYLPCGVNAERVRGLAGHGHHVAGGGVANRPR